MIKFNACKVIEYKNNVTIVGCSKGGRKVSAMLTQDGIERYRSAYYLKTHQMNSQRLPNFLLIVVDDMGYSDCQPFGGEISTPNIKQLAESGVRFRNFHTSALCAPTRAMLLSGCDNHPNTEYFYDFIGQTDHVFSFECFCRNLSLRRFIDRLTEEKRQGTPLIFINIHPNVLLDTSYHSGETLQLLNELGIEPRQVVFELTEKSAVTDFALFEKVLSNYRSQGFRIAIDDVGSGYNSLKTLIYLKPEFIKLDRSLIQNIDQNIEQQQLVSLIMEYAKQSFTKVIAEGIETINELKFIREHGVHYGQGYALGKPNEEVIPGKMPLYMI